MASTKKILLVLLVLMQFAFGFGKCALRLMPLPLNCTIASQNITVPDPCSLLYKLIDVKVEDRRPFDELIEHYQRKTFGCATANIVYLSGNLEFQAKRFSYTAVVRVKNTSLVSAFTVQEEWYRLEAKDIQTDITANTYTGFVRAIETFTQIFTCERFRKQSGKKECTLNSLPINVQDQPSKEIRGLMIDTARHYLPVHDILQTIDAMMYNKMNVLHWYISADDSFPLELKSHPELSENSAFSEGEVYTAANVKEIVRYAMVRGVRVIPQIDSPKETLSWGTSSAHKNAVCGEHGKGHLKVKDESVYRLLKDMFEEIIPWFPDPILHIGSQDVYLCDLEIKPNEPKFEDVNEAALKLYRNRQIEIIKEINPNKTLMMRTQNPLHAENSSRWIQWTNESAIPTTQKLVLSLESKHSLGHGTGTHIGTDYSGEYNPWLSIYDFGPKKLYPEAKNIKGVIMQLWSHTSNRYTHHQKIWIRTSSIADQLWNEVEGEDQRTDALKRVTAHERLMNRRGIPTAPATCQQCEFSPQFC